jgi:Ca-activated chloride channel homolog
VQILDYLGMKYTTGLFSLFAIVLTLAATPAAAQSSFVPSGSAFSAPSASVDLDQGQDSVLTIRKRVDEVNVLFIATDKHGKFVRNLGQTDFAILDDNKPPQSISAFRRETDLPLELGLLVDTSGSVHSRFDFEQDASI